MAANKFMLRHRDIEVEYTIGITPGIPALVYSDGSSVQESFTEAEITTNQTALGTLVSVPLRRSVDTGGERFGFFLPQLDVALGQSEEFHTVGVYERFSGPELGPGPPAIVAGRRAHRNGAGRHSAGLTSLANPRGTIRIQRQGPAGRVGGQPEGQRPHARLRRPWRMANPGGGGVALTTPTPEAPQAATAGVKLRKNVATLTEADLASLRTALTAMESISDDRGYQHWAGIHGLPLPGYCVHSDAAGVLGNLPVGPLFLPWHRAYLYFFELALQDQDPGHAVTLPWWDWTTDPSQPSEIPAAYATETVDGQPNPLSHGPIVAIPDAQWEGESGARQSLLDQTGVDPGPLPAVTFRQPGALPISPAGLPTAKDVDDALAAANFADFSQKVEQTTTGCTSGLGRRHHE